MTDDPIQPYYRAYMDAHGYTEPKPGNQAEFLIWMSGLWHESGLRRPVPDHSRFGPWMRQRVDVFGPVLVE